MSKIILVTGGTGLVGQAIQHVLNDPNGDNTFRKKSDEVWHFIGSKEADLRVKSDAEKLFDKYKPTHVLHLAAVVGGLFKNMAHNLTMLRDNVLINDNVLHVAHERNISKVVSCLSTCVFADEKDVPNIYPLTEEKVHLGPSHPSNFGYAAAKRLVDVQNHAYKQEFGHNFTSAIPTNIFGPHDNFDLEDSHVIPGLIHKCYLAEKNRTVFRPSGSGKPLRQFIYSRDLAKLFIWMIREYNDVEPLILSVPEKEEVSIQYVVEGVVEALQQQRAAAGGPPAAADGQYRKPASNLKLAKLLKESGIAFEFEPFKKALQETVNWFVENYEKGARVGKTAA
ncbi:epimerase-domain-containing protein [Schizopora paradoxa]|uniref:Epimerase-domain-containing protein n=1 Tax=Schizopora paradoxa TaxID=27342 RepID=A0A0H2SER7_9AGAM|nr:epimerase-domain-containing protein [Schizopora paradoxa]